MVRLDGEIGIQPARRAAVDAALLGDTPLAPDADGILAVAQHFGGIQIDPTRTVERTQHLVLWSRLANYDRAELDRLLGERRLLEWNAFIVPLDRLPEILYVARRWPEGGGGWRQRVRDFLAANDEFRRSILEQLRAEGPLKSRQIDDSKATADWQSTGWTHGKNSSQMLEFMSVRTEILVAGRVGQERLWDVAERVVPPDAPRDELSEEEYEERRVMRAMQRFGVATLQEIRLRAYGLSIPAAKTLLARLVEEGRLVAVEMPYPGKPAPAFALPKALERTSSAEASRTTLLSPFDPLIYDRERTKRLFAFDYKLEMYVPKEQRRFGHFVLPVLHGNALVARLDSERDRKTNELVVRRLHWESEPDEAAKAMVEAAISELAAFVRSG